MSGTSQPDRLPHKRTVLNYAGLVQVSKRRVRKKKHTRTNILLVNVTRELDERFMHANLPLLFLF